MKAKKTTDPTLKVDLLDALRRNPAPFAKWLGEQIDRYTIIQAEQITIESPPDARAIRHSVLAGLSDYDCQPLAVRPSGYIRDRNALTGLVLRPALFAVGWKLSAPTERIVWEIEYDVRQLAYVPTEFETWDDLGARLFEVLTDDRWTPEPPERED